MIINDPSKRLCLDSHYFDEMRDKLDDSIQSAVAAMVRKEISSGAVTLKIDIGMIRTKVNDNNAPTGKREALPIEITYKVARTLTAKDEAKGNVVNDLNHELVQDDTKAFFIVSSDEASGQLNLFNGYDELPDDDDDPLEDDEE